VKKIVGVFFLMLLLSACEQPATESVADKPEPVAPAAADVAVAAEPVQKPAPLQVYLLYKVEEPGVEPYESRIIITDEYIRLDENKDGNDFVLVDRKKETVYSVSSDNDAILVVKRKPVTVTSPIELHPDTVRTLEKNAPQIDGRELAHYIFKINGEACQDAMIAEGLMKGATEAIAEYRNILAGQHASTFSSTPADLRNACDMAMHIFQPDRYLQFGLPVHERDHTGYQRSLIDFDDAYEVNPALFTLPAEFGQFSIDEMQVAPADPATTS